MHTQIEIAAMLGLIDILMEMNRKLMRVFVTSMICTALSLAALVLSVLVRVAACG